MSASTGGVAAGQGPANRGSSVSLAQRRPITTFLVCALGIGWPLLAIPIVAGVDSSPFLLLFIFGALLAPALLITRATGGRGAVRALLARALIWRFSPLRWAVILLGIPVLTIALAAVSGTLERPGGGWVAEVWSYLFATLIYGALIINVWEETAWAGFVQTRLMGRHGLMMGSLVTVVPFAAIHIPLYFEGDPSWSEVFTATGWAFLLAPFARYLVGAHLLDTGSLLAVGIQHASWNAAQNIGAVDGDWQFVVATALLAVLVGIGRKLSRSESLPTDLVAERAAATRLIPSAERDYAIPGPGEKPEASRGASRSRRSA